MWEPCTCPAPDHIQMPLCWPPCWLIGSFHSVWRRDEKREEKEKEKEKEREKENREEKEKEKEQEQEQE